MIDEADNPNEGFRVEPATAYPHLKIDADGTVRLERLPRIRVSMIAGDHVWRGWSAAQIVENYPHLRVAEVHSALAYYYDHREEIEGVWNAEDRQLEEEARNRPPSALRERLIQVKKEGLDSWLARQRDAIAD